MLFFACVQLMLGSFNRLEQRPIQLHACLYLYSTNAGQVRHRRTKGNKQSSYMRVFAFIKLMLGSFNTVEQGNKQFSYMRVFAFIKLMPGSFNTVEQGNKQFSFMLVFAFI